MRPAILLLPLALAACDVHSDDGKGNSAYVSISAGGINATVDAKGSDGAGGRDHVSVNVPGFSANMHVAGLNLGGSMDIDGVKMAPGTDVGNMDVAGKDGPGDEKGVVRIAFTNKDDPAKLTDYYRDALAKADFTVQAGDASGLHATKGDKKFDLSLTPDGTGSKGTITITGDHDAD